MFARSRFLHMASLFALTFAIAACSDDDPAGVGKTDTKPPAVSSASAIDVNHVEIAFGEDVDRASAEDHDNYTIVEGDPLLSTSGGFAHAPGDTLAIVALALGSDQRTVTLTTASMDSLRYDITISGVKDKSGNAISTPVASEFIGTTDPDVTPPHFVYRSPGPNEQGVLTSAVLTVIFTEPVTNASLLDMSWSSDTRDVEFSIDSDDGVHIVFTPTLPLDTATDYLVYINAIDEAGNATADSWGFTTTNATDQTPPTIASSIPADLATNVPLDSVITITFSEPMSQEPAFNPMELFPSMRWDYQWLSGTTLQLNLHSTLSPDQQYTLTFFPDGLYDLAGNTLGLSSIVFTTGSQLARGGIAGSLGGDPQSDYASDPTGALVFVGTPFATVGTDVAAANNSYNVQNIPDGDYLVFAMLESNGDGVIDVGRGDAFGLYGIDPRAGDFEESIVTISGGNRVTNAHFDIFDASAITGIVQYNGIYAKEIHDVYIGLFETNGYDPMSEPDYSTYVTWGYFNGFYFDSFDNGPSNGTFYTVAFLDANDNGAYDPAEDPAGFYDHPEDAITVENGSDANDLVLNLDDPPAGRQAPAVAWPAQKPARREWLERVSAMVRKGGRATK